MQYAEAGTLLDAAYRNLSSQDDGPARYAAFCATTARRRPATTPRRHENGSLEVSHGHLKTGRGEALELRGTREFLDLVAVARKSARRHEDSGESAEYLSLKLASAAAATDDGAVLVKMKPDEKLRKKSHSAVLPVI